MSMHKRCIRFSIFFHQIFNKVASSALLLLLSETDLSPEIFVYQLKVLIPHILPYGHWFIVVEIQNQCRGQIVPMVHNLIINEMPLHYQLFCLCVVIKIRHWIHLTSSAVAVCLCAYYLPVSRSKLRGIRPVTGQTRERINRRDATPSF